MMKMSARKKRQAGFVVTAELLLITTVLVLGLLTGLTKVRDQVIAELSDTGSAIGAMNQSYTMQGTTWNGSLTIANVSGFAFTDAADVAAAGEVGGDGTTVIYNAVAAVSTSGDGSGEAGIQ